MLFSPLYALSLYPSTSSGGVCCGLLASRPLLRGDGAGICGPTAVMISSGLTFNLCLIFLCLLSALLSSRMVEYSLDLQNINLSAIRTVRVLRPLKAINRVPSKKKMKKLNYMNLNLCWVFLGVVLILGFEVWSCCPATPLNTHLMLTHTDPRHSLLRCVLMLLGCSGRGHKPSSLI